MFNFFKAAIFGLSSVSINPMPGTYPIPIENSKTVYIEKTFKTFDGLTLHGHLALPRNSHRKLPVVLLLVGSGAGNRYEDVPGEVTSNSQPALLFQSIEEVLINRGLAVFTYDKRGVISIDNTFQNNAVTNDFQLATANNLAADAVSAFDLVSGFPEIDPRRILILGHSEGTILALKVAEARASVHSLLLLGLFTRSFEDMSYYQSVTANIRIMDLIDENGDEYIDEKEITLFHQEAPQNIPDWATMLSIMDYTNDGRISQAEQRFYFEQASRNFLRAITDDSIPWKRRIPRDWFRQYLSEGAFLQRFMAFCRKTHIFHGEADMQTPFEDALELRAECIGSGRAPSSFSSFPGLGHGFSPRVGLKGWKDTIGPLAPDALQRIGEVAESAVN